jgi:TonB family protein
VFRPKVLLPSNSIPDPPFRRRAVLAHELKHIERGDLAWQFLAQITTAIWWFQPLCWFNRRSLRRESEQACDEWVVSRGIRASDYATALLQIATQVGRHAPCPGAATMVRHNELQARLNAVLDSRPRHPGRFTTLKIFGLIALTLVASAVSILPQESNSHGGHPMKRTLISGLLSSAGLTAATIGGSVFDPNGAAIANAQAVLYNPDTGVKQQTTTTPDGKFTFQSLPAGSYILHVEKPGFAALYREFNVESDSDVQRGLVLEAPSNANGGAQALQPLAQSLQRHENAVSEASQSNGPQLIRVGGQSEQANLVTKVNPVYPASAKAAGVQGTVELDVAISKDGVPEDIRVIRSPSDDLTQSALDAVRQWRYRPTLLNGEPVAVIAEVIVNYTLTR